MSQIIHPAQFIRTEIFRIESQEEFARLLGYSQAQISRIEKGKSGLSRKAQQKIRELAKIRGIDWNNDWFFEVPSEPIRRSQGEPGSTIEITVQVQANLIDEAKEAKIDLSALLSSVLEGKLRQRREKKWQDENRGAIESHNRFMKKHGLLSDDWRKF